MARVRDLLFALPNAEYFQDRISAGWRPIAMEWEAPGEPVPELLEPPYGLEVAEDCRHLKANPTEHRVLGLILERMIEGRSFTRIAAELNADGLRTRSGAEWNEVTVYALVPRVIEIAPQIFGSLDWYGRTYFPAAARQP